MPRDFQDIGDKDLDTTVELTIGIQENLDI